MREMHIIQYNNRQKERVQSRTEPKQNKINRNAYNKTYCVYLLPNIYLLYIFLIYNIINTILVMPHNHEIN